MVKNSEQVHGIILVLLSQRAAGSTEEGKRGKTVHFLTSQSGVLNRKVRGVYLSVVMVRTSVSLQYRSPTSLSIFLRAWSSRFRLDSFTCDGTDMIRSTPVKHGSESFSVKLCDGK